MAPSGEAGAAAPDGDVTQTAVMMGSPLYMAPEQMMSARRVDARADVWSLGVILHQLLAGKPPFRGGTVMDIYERILEDASGLRRDVATTVSGFGTALALVRATDLVATVPDRHTAALRVGMESFALPVPVPELTISLLWHPRLDADPAHRWLRELVKGACAA